MPHNEAHHDEPYVGPRHHWRVDLLARTLVAAAPRTGPLVDVGCGDGTLSLVLARAGRTVYAFDRDPLRLARARARVAEAGLAGRVLIFRADATALPFPDATFTGAAAGELLEHIARDDLAMGEIARVLAPCGAVALTVPAGPARMGAADRAVGHVRRYDRAGLVGLIEGAGLRVVLLRGWGFPFGRIYDRWVQRLALAARGRGDGRMAVGRWIGRLGRARGMVALWRGLFAVDERVAVRGARGMVALWQGLFAVDEGVAAAGGAAEREWGSGWVAVGKRK